MPNRDRNQNRRNQDASQQDDDWARQVDWERGRGPYRDYGWERDESALPEFRDPSTHVAPYERRDVEKWRRDNYWQKQGPFQGVGPKNYQRSDDRIMEDVCERLTRHGQIDARNIQVNVKDGEVTLEGAVDSRRTKRMAEDVADDVRGVKDVHNRLHVDESMRNRNSGNPGGGAGRVDRVGRSGVYPASGPMPQGNAPVQGEASWGQGDRGAEGYQDHGDSEINPGTPNKK